jgi:hypothetical protein
MKVQEINQLERMLPKASDQVFAHLNSITANKLSFLLPVIPSVNVDEIISVFDFKSEIDLKQWEEHRSYVRKDPYFVVGFGIPPQTTYEPNIGKRLQFCKDVECYPTLAESLMWIGLNSLGDLLTSTNPVMGGICLGADHIKKNDLRLMISVKRNHNGQEERTLHSAHYEKIPAYSGLFTYIIRVE